MLDIPVAYDPSRTISNQSGNNHHYVAAKLLTGGEIPVELVTNTNKSTNYRDAVINVLVDELSYEPLQQTVLQTLANAMASTPDNDTETLRTYAEFTASLACAWGETVLATRAVLRIEPQKASSFLKTIASALDKKMDKSMFSNLLKNSTSNAVATWSEVERPILFP